ncbi:alpha/beta hydrolase [Nocardia nova]|uniref:alpha/beta hydrolase n=1 Tax=Nocardia nova TaxID=37330 RepID=UPI003F540F5C
MSEKVSFDSQGLKVAGLLYVPEDAQGALPAVVIGHPVTSVKEQSPANYAEVLVGAGFVVLTFDASYQGESEGTPRQLEDPVVRSEDVKNAVSYLTTRSEVDPDRIGAFGICGSGGYVPFAAQSDKRIKAVATASGVNIGDLFRADPDALAEQIATSNAARTAEARGEASEAVDLLPTTKEQAERYPDRSMFREAYDFYKTPRGQNDNAPNTLAPTSYDRIAQFDSWEFIDAIAPRPLLMFAGSDADTLAHSQTAIGKAKDPKELVLIDGASHVDLYDKRVADVTPELIEFFNANL